MAHFQLEQKYQTDMTKYQSDIENLRRKLRDLEQIHTDFK